MLLKNNDHTITVSKLSDREFRAAQGRYDDILDPDLYLPDEDAFAVLEICVETGGRCRRIALVGDSRCDEENCAVLEGNVLTVLQNWIVTQLDVRDGRIMRCLRMRHLGCNFELYGTPKGYLIYGEIDITMLSRECEVLWSFSGGDIWITGDGGSGFVLNGDRICMEDWNGEKWELDLDGNAVRLE